MFGIIFSFVASQILYFALHLESSSFPKPLSARDEIAAFEAMKNGDMAARDKLIRHNLRLVAHIVKKYYASSTDQEDLISIGTIGLIKAVNSFDNTKGARFATYAARCIENEVLMQFRAGKKSQNDVSIQEPIDSDKDGNSLTLNDVVADTFDVHEDYERKEETEALYRVVNRLSGRERQIVIMRYGLSGTQPLTQQQVADILHISRFCPEIFILHAGKHPRKIVPGGSHGILGIDALGLDDIFHRIAVIPVLQHQRMSLKNRGVDLAQLTDCFFPQPIQLPDRLVPRGLVAFPLFFCVLYPVSLDTLLFFRIKPDPPGSDLLHDGPAFVLFHSSPFPFRFRGRFQRNISTLPALPRRRR